MQNLANAHSELNQREAALAAAQEAVTLYGVVDTQHPDEFRPRLAISLNDLANTLNELGQRERRPQCGAGRCAAESAPLLASGPDGFRSGLAMSLNSLAMITERAGRAGGCACGGAGSGGAASRALGPAADAFGAPGDVAEQSSDHARCARRAGGGAGGGAGGSRTWSRPRGPAPRRVSARHGSVTEQSGNQAARTRRTGGCARGGAAGGGTTSRSLAGIPTRFGPIWRCR